MYGQILNGVHIIIIIIKYYYWVNRPLLLCSTTDKSNASITSALD